MDVEARIAGSADKRRVDGFHFHFLKPARSKCESKENAV
jgi:hypothetical protein